MKFIIVSLSILLISLPSLADVQCDNGTIFSNHEKLTLPSGNDLNLVLNGVGLETIDLIFTIDIFYAAFYLERRSSNSQQIIDNNEVKRSVLHALRFIEKQDLINNWNDEFERLCKDQCEKLEPYHQQMLSYVEDVQENERLILTHHSDRLELSGERSDGSFEERPPIMSGDYSNLILDSFIGPEPNNESLKQGMLGNDSACS